MGRDVLSKCDITVYSNADIETELKASRLITLWDSGPKWFCNNDPRRDMLIGYQAENSTRHELGRCLGLPDHEYNGRVYGLFQRLAERGIHCELCDNRPNAALLYMEPAEVVPKSAAVPTNEACGCGGIHGKYDVVQCLRNIADQIAKETKLDT